jgi:hypothetical protein
MKKCDVEKVGREEEEDQRMMQIKIIIFRSLLYILVV